MKMFLSLIIMLSLSIGIDCKDGPRVRVKQGEMEGSEMTSFSETKFFGFRGIPYGKPPVGPLRFKISQPADAWEGILDASKDGPICSQNLFLGNGVAGQEDCLFLNVYTPQLPSNDTSLNLPVMAYIHGGGFSGGTGSSAFAGPNILLDRNVVLVAMNYRLSVFGFLSTADDVSSGNYGLWDQNLALKWIQENIRAFGGNPDQVTIFGASAGGASVSYHLISPASKGLFHRAIVQSGTALCPWAFQSDPLMQAKRLAKDLNCPTTPNSDLVECIRQKDVKDILDLSAAYSKDGVLVLPFVPSVEKIDGVKFLDDLPRNLFRNGRINRVPVISGITANEGLDFALDQIQKLKKLEGDELTERIKVILAMFGGLEIKDVPRIIELYLKNISLDDVTKPDLVNALVDAASDGLFKAGNQQLVLDLSMNNIPVYMYMTEHALKYSWVKFLFGENITGVSHAQDMSLVINIDTKLINMDIPEKLEGDDKVMSEKVKDLWVNFATYGNPTPEEGKKVEIKWKQVIPGEIDYLSINLPLQMKYTSLSENLKFWSEKLAEKEMKKQK